MYVNACECDMSKCVGVLRIHTSWDHWRPLVFTSVTVSLLIWGSVSLWTWNFCLISRLSASLCQKSRLVLGLQVYWDFASCHMGAGIQTQVLMLQKKFSCPLRYLSTPLHLIFWDRVSPEFGSASWQVSSEICHRFSFYDGCWYLNLAPHPMWEALYQLSHLLNP